MNRNVRGRAGDVWFAVAVTIFLLAVAYAVFAALRGSDFANSRDDALLLILGIASVLSLAGWWRDRARARSSEEARRDRERLEAELRERETALREAEEAYRAERNWRQELHAEIAQFARERGALGDPSDVPSMVLRLARTLVDAEKGLLLSRRDEDGELDLIASEGFEHDPKDSAVVRRFAEEVVERDQTVRAAEPGEVGAGQLTQADEEIENLIAIPIYLQDEFSGVVICANNPDGFDDYDDDVLLSVGDHAGAVLHNARLQGELRASYLATVGVLADAVEAKDPLLRGHSEEVSTYVAAVAEHLDLPPRRREELIFGSLLHDIGKIGISERILLKPAALTPGERAVIELHPRIGYRLLQQVPALRSIAPAILHHHERFDGNGYPSGLRGEEIPLEARIICVADCFSAMISERPYRERITPDEACAELERHAGTQFDPEVVRVFVDEVRHRPPTPQRLKAVAADSELEVRLDGDEPVLGHGPLAVIDNLTMLYTRRYLHEVAHAEAQQAEVQGQPFGVVLVEMTELTELNRRAGYAAGDRAIQAVARVVQSVGARHGGTACRYSGRRLGLVIPGADEQTATLLAGEISVALKEGPKVRAAAAAWHPGDTGDAVISRSRAHLG